MVLILAMAPGKAISQSYIQTSWVPFPTTHYDRDVYGMIGPGTATFSINNSLSVTGSTFRLEWGLFVKELINPPQETPESDSVTLGPGLHRLEFWSVLDIQRGTETWQEVDSTNTYSRYRDETVVLEIDIKVLD